MSTLAARAYAQAFDINVVDRSQRHPVAFATVSLLGDNMELVRSAVLTDSLGHLRLSAPEPGRYRLVVRRVGYEPVTTEAKRLTAGEVEQVTILLNPIERVLDTVMVQGMGIERRMLEFRRNHGAGKIVTRGQIDSMKYRSVEDIVVSKGGKLRYQGTRWALVGSGATCTGYNVFLNGLRLNNVPNDAEALKSIVETPIEHVQVLEVYASGVSVPPEYATRTSKNGLGPCAVLALWTRDLK